MQGSLAWLPLLAPMGLLAASVAARRDHGSEPRAALGATRAASTFALLVAAATAALAAQASPLQSPLLGHDGLGLGLSVRVDALSAVMLALVAILGALVIHFSRNYLAGDRRHAVFLGDLALTVACVMVLVLAGNLLQLVVGWVTTSLALHRLLLFYPERRGAVVAARKKFVVARLGDACLVLAAVALVRQFGSGDLGAVLEGAAAMAKADRVPAGVHVAAALVGLTAFLKAAQFPAHGWLIEMQETPTPVSALLHAGILNGGTFLIVRLAGVVELSVPVLIALVLVGGFTAVFASVVMLTDARIKATLAYSSAAHMGFMLLLCGVGATAVAIAHLVAHSFYKAHAFLSSGSAVDAARLGVVPAASRELSAGRIIASYVFAAGMVWCAGTVMGFAVLETPRSLALAAVMVIALAHLMAQGARGEPSARVIGRTALSVTLTALSFYALERGAGALLHRAVPETRPSGGGLAVVVAAVLAIFGLVTVLQLLSPRGPGSRFWTAAYVVARNGLYANAFFDRLVGAHRGHARQHEPKPVAILHGPADEGRSRPAAAAPDAVMAAIERATRAVAPVWPLESFVAVNPFLGLTDQTFADAAHAVARTAGARMTMPRPFYADALASGRMGSAHLEAAIADARGQGLGDVPRDAATLLAVLRDGTPPPRPAPAPTVADVVSEITGHDWVRVTSERIGAWAATYFDEGQASWPSPWKDREPYRAFCAEAALDATPEIFGARGFRAAIGRLTGEERDAALTAIERLGIPEAGLDLYLQRLLASIGGWAAYARRRGWDRELHGETDTTLEHVLLVRLAWEVALLEVFGSLGVEAAWSRARAALTDARPDADGSRAALHVDLVLQAAYEKAWQETLRRTLASRATPAQRSHDERPTVHAAFCIDVRSEVFRRALEEAEPTCETLGFAGFFGFPVEYVPLGQERGRAQCPVLLAPKGVIVESVVSASRAESTRAARARVLDRRAGNAWRSFKTSAVACFGFVGPVGLAYLPKLVSDALRLTRTVPHPSRDGVDSRADLGPDLSCRSHGGRQVGLHTDTRVAMAEGLLRGMSLTSGFARLVLIVGHGSTTVNNPHAAGLDCGACGGQSGEANARIAAAVLNEPAVREALAGKGIDIPADTVFLGCLHDTTTDVVTIFDRHVVPASHAQDLQRLEAGLAAAGAAARRHRAPRLGEDPSDPSCDARILARSRDWAQVRPEWGLAGCAAFLVAPRARTRGLDLGGRSFLHSYDWREDERNGFPVLELVMTAPMVVASWISLQYYASTVDNGTFGCGNKVLHNVVGTLGVLEGNGGDLRVGLPWQSVHDGRRLVHEPMRLDVLIEAPIAALNQVLARHASVRALLDNGWLHLHAIGDAGAVTHRYAGGMEWEPVEASATEVAA